MTIHVVKPGDSIYRIAQMYGVPFQQIITDNRLPNPDRLVVGQTIVISDNNVITHYVQPGETIYSIASRYGVRPNDIINANPQLENPNSITVGQRLSIPGPRTKRSIIVNGYTYPTNNLTVLREAFPHLTYISIFSYQVLPDGNLTPIDDENIINQARQAGVASKMVITNIEEGASFSSELARQIFTSQQAQDRLIQNIINTMRQKGYVGVDIDFEYLFPEDRERYNAFLQRVRNAIQPLGFSLSTAVAPKISAGQQGLLYEAHDYPAHGRYADEVIIMTYEWGYTYGAPMAVAPIDQVEKVVQYAVTAIPPSKILLGIPNYGYDWTLPFVQGTAARSISNPAAVELAARENAEIFFDNTAQSPYFNYFDDNGREHVVWFEDARSIYAKLQLVNRYNLGGVSYWTVNNSFPQNWLVLRSMFDVTKVL